MGSENQSGRGRGRPRSQESEKAILDATMELLSELGFRAVTVDAIAARAGASKSTIYRRWPTKENLVIAAFGETPLLAPPPRGDMVSQLVEVIRRSSRAAMQDTHARRRAAGARRRTRRTIRRWTGRWSRWSTSGARPPWRTSCGGGRARRTAGRDQTSNWRLIMLTAPVLQRIMVMGPPTDRRFVRQVVQMVCSGLRAAGRCRSAFMRTIVQVESAGLHSGEDDGAGHAPASHGKEPRKRSARNGPGFLRRADAAARHRAQPVRRPGRRAARARGRSAHRAA